jgi:hypothetical protein
MTPQAPPSPPWPSRVLRWLAIASLAGAVALLVGAVPAPARPTSTFELAVTAGLLYLVAHLLRAVRLAMLLLFERPSIRMLLSVHFATAWLSAAIPFKLGEATRVAGLMGLARQPATGLAAYVIEKLLDALVLLAVVVLVAAAGGVPPAQGLLASVLLLLVAAGGAAYFSARALIGDVRTLLVSDSCSERGLRVLAVLRFLDVAHASLRAMMHGRVALLLLLTMGVWTFDLAAFVVIAAAAGATVSLPGDFLETLQSMLVPSTSLPTAAPYGWLVALCLAIAAVPASIGILMLARRRAQVLTRWRQSAQHKQYSHGEHNAPDS